MKLILIVILVLIVFICPTVPSSVPFNVPVSSDDFCNHPQDVCSGASVASAGMPCAGVINVVSANAGSSRNVDGVAVLIVLSM